MAGSEQEEALKAYVSKVREHRKFESGLKGIRDKIKAKQGEFDKSEFHIKALQSVGQIIAEYLTKLDDQRHIVKASSGPRYVVVCKEKLDKAKLLPGTRV